LDKTEEPGRHRLNQDDLGKRRGDRRRMALQALSSALAQHAKDSDVAPSLTPLELAEAWDVHPSSAYRVLERLRRGKAVERAGLGLTAEYQITEMGQERLEWFKEFDKARARFAKKKRGRIAANPGEET